MLLLAHVVQELEKLYPLRYAESWDHPGLIVGDLAHPVRKIYMAVDPTEAIVEEAKAFGADLIVTHHPLFFRSVHEMSGLSHRGAIVSELYRSGIGLWVGHTNADAAHRGVSEALADVLGVCNYKPLVALSDPSSPYDGELGLGRVGELEQAMSLRDFAERVNAVLPPTRRGIDVAGNLEMPVKKVAVLGGSGDSEFDAVRAVGADVYVTSDLRHHPVLDAVAQADNEAALAQLGIIIASERVQEVSSPADYSGFPRPAFINTPHYASEKPFLTYAQHDVAQVVREKYGVELEIAISPTDTDPIVLHLSSPTEPVMPSAK